MSRYTKFDANHSEISRALEQIGVGVINTASCGGGMGDLVTMYRGKFRVLEIKDGDKPPSARKLTIAQVRLHDLARTHGCVIHVVTSVDDALRVHGARV